MKRTPRAGAASAYPHTFTFEQLTEHQLAAITQAALDLQLPFEILGAMHRIEVTVRSATEAYDFGSKTHDVLRRHQQ